MDKFDDLLKNVNYTKIANVSASYYQRYLDYDEIESCKMIGMWNATKNFNGKIKFTSHLYNCVKWECLKRIKENKFGGCQLTDVADKPKIESRIMFLPEELRQIILLRYVDRMTLHEIGKVCGFSHETARQKLKKAKELLRLKMVYNLID